MPDLVEKHGALFAWRCIKSLQGWQGSTLGSEIGKSAYMLSYVGEEDTSDDESSDEDDQTCSALTPTASPSTMPRWQARDGMVGNVNLFFFFKRPPRRCLPPTSRDAKCGCPRCCSSASASLCYCASTSGKGQSLAPEPDTKLCMRRHHRQLWCRPRQLWCRPRAVWTLLQATEAPACSRRCGTNATSLS